MEKKKATNYLIGEKISERGIEIIILLVSLASIALSPVNAYKISNTFSGMQVEQLAIYKTIIIDVLLTISMLTFAVYMKYRKQDNLKAYILVRTYALVVIFLHGALFLIGLNIGSEFSYDLLMPWWLFIILNTIIVGLSITFVSKAYIKNIFRDFVNIYSLLITLLYLYIFVIIIMDSGIYLGLA